jgi:hypothetical protein
MQPPLSNNHNELLSYTKLVRIRGGRDFDDMACLFVAGYAIPPNGGQQLGNTNTCSSMLRPRAETLSMMSPRVPFMHALMHTHPDRRAADALRIYEYFVLNRGTTVKLGILMETRQQLLTATFARLCLCL